MSDVSVIVITLNEEENIKECLESVMWADEIIVVDSGSTDKTCDVARAYTSKIFHRKFDTFSKQKNFAASKASCKWILSLDADERVTPQLATEITSAISRDCSELSGYNIYMKNYWFGHHLRYGGWSGYNGQGCKLFLRGRAIYKGDIHEKMEVQGKVDLLKHPIDHFGFASIAEYFRKFNAYTTREYLSLAESNRRVSCLRDLLWAPIIRFVKAFFLRRGYKDGIPGFIVAVFAMVYTFVTYAKLWEHQQDHPGQESA